MKSLFAIAIATFTLSSQASWKLESFYGKLFVKNGEFHCTYTNDTGRDLDFKYVQFLFSRAVGSDTVVEVKNRIDTILPAGETLTVGSGQNMSVTRQYCKFMAR